MRVAARTRPAAVLVVLQIAAIVALGAVTALRFHVFAAVDELAHVSYVQDIAEQGALPRLDHTYVSWQMEAIEQDTYPRRSSVDPRQLGLAGQSYEAFQPPLYYLLAVPAFSIPSNYRTKVIAVRFFDLLLLLAAVAILALLARALAAEHWLALYAAGLSVALWPGVIVRAITVSNAALETPLVLLYVLAIWHATRRRDGRLLLAAAALLGLCLLTAVTLIYVVPLLLIPLWAILRERRDRATLAAAAVATVLPLVLLAPWLISNETRYGALTADSLAKRMQLPLLNPTGQHYGLSSVLSGVGGLTRALLPQEWWSQYAGAGVALRLLPILLLAAVLLALARRPRLVATTAAGVLLLPFVLGALTLAGILVLADWPSFLPRYLNVTFVMAAMFAAWSGVQLRVRNGVLVGAAAAVSIVVAGVWVYMAGAYYFTNVGAALGIHA